MAALSHRPGCDQLTSQTSYKALAGGSLFTEKERAIILFHLPSAPLCALQAPCLTTITNRFFS